MTAYQRLFEVLPLSGKIYGTDPVHCVLDKQNTGFFKNHNLG